MSATKGFIFGCDAEGCHRHVMVAQPDGDLADARSSLVIALDWQVTPLGELCVDHRIGGPAAIEVES